MANFQIWEKPIPPTELPTYLRLRTTADGIVQLIACDEKGEKKLSGCLLGIDTDGTIELYSDVNSQLGFKLDDCQRVKTK